MYSVINVSEWKKSGYSKGTREKMNVVNPDTKEECMFKYPAEYDKKIYGDTWSEKIASEVGKILKIQVQETELALYNGDKGILVKYSLNMEKEELIEGAVLIKAMIPDFIENKRDYFTFETIENCLISEGIELEKFLDIIFFDTVIGNTDRHSENWGIVKNYETNEKRISAAYDNGSSLGREHHCNEIGIINIDIEKYTEKAKSCIRIKEDKRINLYDFFKETLKKAPNKRTEFLIKIDLLTVEKIEEILEKIPEEFMSLTLKNFVRKILLTRKDKIKKILEEEENL